MLLYLLGGAGIAAALALWKYLADGDLSTLYAYYFCQGERSKYKGRVIWITGASSGIGEEIAYIFAHLGSRLVLSGTNEERLERVKRTCEQMGAPEVLLMPGNIASTATHPEMVQKVLQQFGKIHVLVNNAGRSQRSEFTKIPEQIEREMFDINVFGMMSLTRLIVAEWLKKKQDLAEILVTSSTAGKIGAPFSATYTATKHALHGYFEALRSELCILESPIRITMACPGPVRSHVRVHAYTDTVGVTYNQPDEADQQLMATNRCAQLMVSGLAAGLDELWICQQPILAGYYLQQYLPSLFRRFLLSWVMNKDTPKMRDGK